MDKLNFNAESFESYSGHGEYEEEALVPYAEFEAFDEFSPVAGGVFFGGGRRAPPSSRLIPLAPRVRPGRPATGRPPSRRRPVLLRGRPRPPVVRRPRARTIVVDAPSPPTEFIRWVQSYLHQLLGLILPLNGIMTAATRAALRLC